MSALSDYMIDEEIHENDRIRVYKGHMIRDHRAVIIKVLREDAANHAGISRLLYEYEITRNIDIDGIVKPLHFEQTGTVFALVMEDTGAVSLREYIRNSPVNIQTFLDLAEQLAETLGQLHQAGVVHRDLKPENILIHPETKKVKIIDFGAAILWRHDGRKESALHSPAGTVQYMSPEQTGWIERNADYRSDFYSLGAVYYELLAGRLPWQAGNAAEWVHAHIARKPEFQDETDLSVQPILAIVLKLLSKTADERYQSAYGLLQDLRECRFQLSQEGRIEQFPLGSMDISMNPHLTCKLYGRETEITCLKAAFESVCAEQSLIILVSGSTGVGKTMLVREALEPYVTNKGYFIAGKFDQLRQNRPYAPFAAALGSLVKQILTESQEALDRWKKRILHTLGRNGMVITEVIPEVEWLVGSPHEVEVLPPKEAQNRFLLVLSDFVRIFARKEHPLVLFLDDLQWADSASLQLLQYLSKDKYLPYFLFVGAYRNNETNETHPLLETLEIIKKGEIPVQYMELSCLNYSQALEFLREALHCSRETCGPLAGVLYRKSGGNPFILCQLLKFIHKEKLISFNTVEGCWDWELSTIQNLQMQDDVVGLILEKLKKLPLETQELLKTASCIGSSFDLDTLSIVREMPRNELSSWLLPAVLEGFILAATGRYMEQCDQGIEAKHYEFLHDRIQQAVYSLLPEEEKRERHLKIGRLILQHIGHNQLYEKILFLMDQFNRGLDLIEEPEERRRVAEYNLMAGRKAKASAAYDSALQYFRAGMAMLPEDAWANSYRLSYGLHLELAQVEYLSANLKTAEALFDAVIGQAGTEIDRASIYSLKMVLFAGMGKYAEALQTGIQALHKLGINFPSRPGKLDIIRELLMYRWIMFAEQRNDSADMQELKEAVKTRISELLVRLACIISIHNPKAYGYTILKTCNYSIRYGNADMASIGYAGYGIIAGSMLGDYRTGYELAGIGIRLADRCSKSYAKCYVNFVMGSIVSHWTQPARAGIDYLNKAIRYGMEAGDLLLTGYSCRFVLEIKYLSGYFLGEIEEEIEREQTYARKMKHEYLAVNTILYRSIVSFLKGKENHSFSFEAHYFDEGDFLESMERDHASRAAYYILKMQLCYLSGDYEKALCAGEEIKGSLESVIGFIITAEHNYYHSLAIAAIYEKLPSADRKKHWKILKKNQKQMKKWADSCQENFRHKYLLVAAETARLLGKGQEAMSLYDQAIDTARENGYIQNEALANELAARFYMAGDHAKIARVYMTDACRGYSKWGAAAKTRALQKLYPGLLDERLEKEIKPSPVDILKSALQISDFSGSEPTSSSDTDILQKAIRHISEETDPDKLLKGFLDFAVRLAGADRGYLILEKEGQLFIEAAGPENRQTASARAPVAVEKCGCLSKAVVRYVARTLETVVLDGNDQARIFAADAYIMQAKVKSIACLPILFQGIPAGAIYLENSLLEKAFIPEKLEIIKLLSAQLVTVKKLQDYLEVKSEERKSAAVPLVEPLTGRETEVLQLIAEGMSNKEIAGRLGITDNTVKGYIKNIYGKLGANRRVQVAARAKDLGLLKTKQVL